MKAFSIPENSGDYAAWKWTHGIKLPINWLESEFYSLHSNCWDRARFKTMANVGYINSSTINIHTKKWELILRNTWLLSFNWTWIWFNMFFHICFIAFWGHISILLQGLNHLARDFQIYEMNNLKSIIFFSLWSASSQGKGTHSWKSCSNTKCIQRLT